MGRGRKRELRKEQRGGKRGRERRGGEMIESEALVQFSLSLNKNPHLPRARWK